MKLPFKIVNIPKNNKRGWYGGAFTFTFVYAPEGNFLLKGYLAETQVYIREHFQRCFYRMVLYGGGEHRSIFRFSKCCNLSISEIRLRRQMYSNRYVVTPSDYTKNLDAIKLKFKRFPNRWIPEFDYLIDKFTTTKDSYAIMSTLP